MEVSGQLHAPAALPPEIQSPVPKVCWVGPRAAPDPMEKIKILLLLGIEPWLFGYPACSLVAILTELSCLPVIFYMPLIKWQVLYIYTIMGSFLQYIIQYMLVTVAARSKAWNVFARLNIEIVGSNRARGMDVCVYSVFVLSCVSRGLATGWSLVQAVLPTVYNCKITEPHEEEAKAPYGLQRHIRRRRTQYTVYI
jgi:hypothetical protein